MDLGKLATHERRVSFSKPLITRIVKDCMADVLLEIQPDETLEGKRYTASCTAAIRTAERILKVIDEA